MFCDYSKLVTLYKIGEVHFRLLCTNGFPAKAKNERFTERSPCPQNLKNESFTSSFGRLRQRIASKSVPHVQLYYFYSFNQSNHRFVALSLPSSFLKLPNDNQKSGDGFWLLGILSADALTRIKLALSDHQF